MDIVSLLKLNMHTTRYHSDIGSILQALYWLISLFTIFGHVSVLVAAPTWVLDMPIVILVAQGMITRLLRDPLGM